MEKKNILKNKILNRRDQNGIIENLQLRNYVLGRGKCDINLIVSEILTNECLVISSYIDNVLVAAAYIKCLNLNGEEVLLIDDIFVTPELRNRGIGTQLLYYILGSKAKINSHFKRNCQKIVLVPRFGLNKAIYSRVGFSDINENFMARKI